MILLKNNLGKTHECTRYTYKHNAHSLNAPAIWRGLFNIVIHVLDITPLKIISKMYFSPRYNLRNHYGDILPLETWMG